MKLYSKMILLGALAFGMASCKKNYLEVVPGGEVSDATVWQNSNNADLFLNDVYNQLYDMNNTYQSLEEFTDNVMCGASWFDAQGILGAGALAPNNLPGEPANLFSWTANYQYIRKCNLFITKVRANAANFPADWVKERLAEAQFLRAYYYSSLWATYGGVPIITVPLNNLTQGDSIYYARSTFEETYNFITTQCDSAAAVLPLTVDKGTGRPTKGAALTLKAWCALFAASPLTNAAQPPTGNDPNHLLTFGTADNARWATAAAAAKAVMDLNTYSLFPDYSGMWLGANNDNQEDIFSKQYIALTKGGQREGFWGPCIVHGTEQSWSSAVPTQELVDCYYMANGKRITDAGSGYDTAHPYLNREPRFYQSIVFDGAPWQGDTIFTRMGGNNQIDLGSTSDITNTGYYIRKTVDESITGQASRADKHPGGENYKIFRYAEVLLSYAEAQNEAAGPDQSVYDAVNKIRARASLPQLATGLSQAKMRDEIRNERRVELAIEDKRWWDIRRWKIADGTTGVMNTPSHGMQISRAGNNLTYKQVKAVDRIFYARNYWMPVPQDALDTNSKLVQSAGY
ncbi:RagB/SusD family nutrient uptake outer membrane protein [Chitinophaga parva]|uniref:RagB/SusD family nutrient uptake outer membrane protein n=1 Tax=Chitinophaga parva TaxID=2169414 RepID=A0A2T7BQ12_9BACT|nr:RagB/SusD family nutrient uptake outer membrane protein [Chitinophaga parva]PUZ29768.1 RagB/SusD family nutrient uptake outer membrane protein [Chitinophaga parva]